MLKSEKSQYIEQLTYLISKDWFIDKFPFLKFDLNDGDKFIEENIDIVLKEIKTECLITQDQYEFRRIAMKLSLNRNISELYKLYFSHPFHIGALTIIISIFLLPFGSIILPEKSIFPIFNSTVAIGTAVALSTYCVIFIIDSLVKLLESEFDLF